MTLKVGDKAPDFTLLNEHEEPVKLSKLRGQKVVLYFYPKDSTPGCTQEACDFRDHYSKFKKLGVAVYGISKDSAKKHQGFIAKHELPFNLLVDEDTEVCKLYDVLKPKSMFGKSYLGIVRSTFLIDEKGKISAIWPKVKVAGHVEQIIDELS